MRARELELMLCEDWLVYMYDPLTHKLYYYNSELSEYWPNEGSMYKENGVQKYILPRLLQDNRILRDTGLGFDPVSRRSYEW